MLGAFSVALAVPGAGGAAHGRLIDRGGAPRAMTLGTVGALLGLAALTQVTVLWQFYAVWAWLGLMMAATLYDAAFSIVTRARGARARAAITAITLAAGFASTLAYPLTAAVSDAGRLARPRSGCWRLVLVIVLPLHRLAATRLEAEAQARDPASVVPPPGHRRDGRPGFWPLGLGFALTALGAAILLTNLLPLMAALGVPGDLAILAASVIGPAQVAGRVVLTLAGARAAARAVTLGRPFVISGAALVLGAAPALPAVALSSRWGWAWATASSRSCARSSSARSWATAATAKAPGPWRACRFSPSRRPRASARRWPTRRVTARSGAVRPVPACRAQCSQASADRMNEKGGPLWAAPSYSGDRRGSAIRRFRPRWPSCRLRDLDPARFQRLGHFAHEVDMQHAVLMGSAGHAHMIGQLEPLFEGAGGDAAMQVGARRLVLVLAGGDDKLGLALFHRQLGIGEAGHGDRDAIGIIGRLLDVVGRVGRGRGVLRQDAVQTGRPSGRKPTVAR
jgi:MFS family permease